MVINPIHLALLSPIAKEKLYIKYMVSLRCKLLVQEELRKLNINHLVVELGAVELLQDISPEQREILKQNLLKSGLELLDNKKSILVEKLRIALLKLFISQKNNQR